jgi:hypothetical protein
MNMNPYSLVLALLLPLFAGTAAASESAIRNLGFEDDPQRPLGWKLSQHAGVMAYENAIDAEVFHEGSQSFRMRRVKEQVYGLVEQRMRVPSGEAQRLRLGAHLRTRGVGPQGWVLTATFVDIEGGIIDQVRADPLSGDTDWTPVALEAAIPANAYWVAFGVLLLDEGTGWVDEVQVRIGGD